MKKRVKKGIYGFPEWLSLILCVLLLSPDIRLKLKTLIFFFSSSTKLDTTKNQLHSLSHIYSYRRRCCCCRSDDDDGERNIDISTNFATPKRLCTLINYWNFTEKKTRYTDSITRWLVSVLMLSHICTSLHSHSQYINYFEWMKKE